MKTTWSPHMCLRHAHAICFGSIDLGPGTKEYILHSSYKTTKHRVKKHTHMANIKDMQKEVRQELFPTNFVPELTLWEPTLFNCQWDLFLLGDKDVKGIHKGFLDRCETLEIIYNAVELGSALINVSNHRIYMSMLLMCITPMMSWKKCPRSPYRSCWHTRVLLSRFCFQYSKPLWPTLELPSHDVWPWPSPCAWCGLLQPSATATAGKANQEMEAVGKNTMYIYI